MGSKSGRKRRRLENGMPEAAPAGAPAPAAPPEQSAPGSPPAAAGRPASAARPVPSVAAGVPDAPAVPAVAAAPTVPSTPATPAATTARRGPAAAIPAAPATPAVVPAQSETAARGGPAIQHGRTPFPGSGPATHPPRPDTPIPAGPVSAPPSRAPFDDLVAGLPAVEAFLRSVPGPEPARAAGVAREPAAPAVEEDPLSVMLRRIDVRLDEQARWLAAWSRWQAESSPGAADAREARWRTVLVLVMTAIFAHVLAFLIFLSRSGWIE